MELVGHIGVDAGLCWVGDPCYVIHKLPKPVIDHIKRLTTQLKEITEAIIADGHELPLEEIQKDLTKTEELLKEYDQAYEAVGNNWGEFCDKLHHDSGHTSFGNTGAAVSTGWGDGSYPVYVRRGTEGRVSEVFVRFMGEEEGY